LTRSLTQVVIDLLTFPLRAFLLFEEDKWGFSSLRSERFDYVSREIRGYCLDVGCGRNNIFIKKNLKGNGNGIDIFPYDGLGKENLIDNISRFPFENETFDSISFIACINHIPEQFRDIELQEAFRCLKHGGNIIITLANPLAGILVHQVVRVYDLLLGTNHDMDNERGMDEGEQYYLKNQEVKDRLHRAGFESPHIKYFLSQWGFNHLFVAYKKELHCPNDNNPE
jgi:SAM-dependent methyltransferase